MPRILVIDDGPDIRAVLGLMLRASGHEVVVAADGAEGLKRFRERPTDVVITDLFMPNQEGMETILEFRRDFPNVGIIAMSGETGDGTALSAARSVGAAAILEKPFFPNDVMAAIASALRQEPKASPARNGGCEI